MNDELRVTSGIGRADRPFPWRVKRYRDPAGSTSILDANGAFVSWEISRAVAEFVVKAANDHDLLRDLVRRLCDMIADHPVWRPSEAERWLINEARKAIGEEAR